MGFNTEQTACRRLPAQFLLAEIYPGGCDIEVLQIWPSKRTRGDLCGGQTYLFQPLSAFRIPDRYPGTCPVGDPEIVFSIDGHTVRKPICVAKPNDDPGSAHLSAGKIKIECGHLFGRRIDIIHNFVI